MKIMLVEDDTQISFLMSEFLQAEGYEVSCADHGKMALDMLSEQGMPGIILLDMMMPVMDGTEFANIFHSKYQNACPIVVMSAAIDIEKRASEVNAVAWISKPLTFDEILKLVKKNEKKTNK